LLLLKKRKRSSFPEPGSVESELNGIEDVLKVVSFWHG
jgi:hypothetical protein